MKKPTPKIAAIADELIAKFARETGTRKERVAAMFDKLAAQTKRDDDNRALEALPRIPAGKEVVLTISDLHHPYAHPDAHDFLDALAQKYNPTQIVGLGDELDFHSVSQYIKDMSAQSATDELDMGVAELQSLYELFPKMRVCVSNHTVRPFKKAAGAELPVQVLRTYREFMGAPDGWEWRDSWHIDDWGYEHGEAVNGKHAAVNYAEGQMMNVAFGHGHSTAGVAYVLRRARVAMGLACSCLIDPGALAFRYGKTAYRRAMIGTGVIVRNIPVYHPMLTDARGRWIRKLAF